MINVIVAGATGRVGSLIVRLVENDDTLQLAGTADIDASLEKVIDKADVVIDFTAPEAAARHAELAAEHTKPMLIGTTGLNGEQNELVHKAAQRIPILHAPNMSLGVTVLMHLITTAAHTLGSDFRVEIMETHHAKKVDSPSGTANKMLKIVADERKTDGEEIEVTSFREGDVIGDHSIKFISHEEVLELKHSALTRELFAHGAVVAARWIADKKPGLYDMSDVLNLK